MSKVASYLQEHISGEVSTNPAILKAMSTDASVLEITPEMVVYPRVTNDIRKVARFAWQLAEKGHSLPLTPRGHGGDETGAAIGPGIILSFPAHMNNILEFDPKQKLVRLQSGVKTKTLSDALLLHGIGIPAMPTTEYSTVGGAVANNAASSLAGSYGTIGDWVYQLEVVLANGDMLQTERISKHELRKRKGMQTFEGEIYRNLDGLIEDNKELIAQKLTTDIYDNIGYSSLAKVKQKDGSFDLTPLFVGSQGTLGIISEMILRNDFVSLHTAVSVAAFPRSEMARDVLDALASLEPAFLEYYDGELFAAAAERGKRYDVCRVVEGTPGAVVVVGFNDFNERARRRKLKKAHKLLESLEASVESADGEEAVSLLAVREVTAYNVVPADTGASAPPLVDGAYIPPERIEEFFAATVELAKKYHLTLPLHYRVLQGTVYTRPTLHLRKVSDKQKIFKLLDEYSGLVIQNRGHLIGQDGEGRVKARFADKELDPDVRQLFQAVKAVFDPYNMLNPGVKQEIELRYLVSHLRSDYDTAVIKDYVPYN
jgi:FAD/FMN-containing dehydrogenase